MVFRSCSTSQVAAALFAASLAACAEKGVDVGHNAGPSAPASASSTAPPAPIYATSAPPPDAGAPFLIVQNEEVLAFTASAGRVFWLSVDEMIPSVPPPIPEAADFHLRSCETTNCAGTLWSTSIFHVHDGGATRTPGWIFANDTRVFWPNVDEGRGISFCAREEPHNCGSLGVNGSSAFAADDDRAYFGGALTCDIVDCSDTAIRQDSGITPGLLPLIVLDGDYLYEASNPMNAAGNILRRRKDGTGTIQFIVKDQPGLSALAVRNGQVYWSEASVLGRVYRCPTEGCDGDPAVVIAELNLPSALAVDDENVYIKIKGGGAVGRSSGQIVRCSLAGCAAPTVIVAAGAGGALFVDSDFVYYGTRSCDQESCGSAIAAVRK
jgi:hypothetical protein